MQSLSSMKLHWIAPLQTKGFLRIIQFVLAIVTLALVAGFHMRAHIRCNKASPSDAITVNVKYPFTHYTYTNSSAGSTTTALPYSKVGSASQLFVAWGVLSLFYCLAALAVYVIFTANERMEKLVDALIYTDLVFNILWALMWFIASTEWTVAFIGMRSTITDDVLTYLVKSYAPYDCASDDVFVTDQDTYGQAAVASVFGFLCVIVWAASVCWVFIDTAFFIKWRARSHITYSNV